MSTTVGMYSKKVAANWPWPFPRRRWIPHFGWVIEDDQCPVDRIYASSPEEIKRIYGKPLSGIPIAEDDEYTPKAKP